MNGITKLCEIYGIGDHRPQGSIGHISKLAAGAPAIEPRKSPSILRELKQAKEHSDNKQYKDKAGVMRGLLTAHTDDFFVDSELNKDIVGVTHIPTGFRMHLLRTDIPPVLLEREDMSTSKLAFMKKVAVVRKVDGKWVLYTKDKSRVLGTHETPKEAYAQEYAIEKSQEREATKSASATTPVAVNTDTGEITYAGFTVNKKQPDWLKNRPDVAGFYGDATGDANSDPTQAGTITVNDLADVWKKNPQGKDALKKLEAVRGVYSLKPDILHAAPDLTDEQDKNLNFYTESFKLAPDKAKLMRKGTFYSRAAVGDLLNPNGNKEPKLSTDQLTHLKDINTVLNDKSWYSKHKAEQLKPAKSASAPGKVLVKVKLDSNGKSLLHHYLTTKEWGYPGGKAEPDEEMEDAAVRELKELTGYHIDKSKLKYDGVKDKHHQFSGKLADVSKIEPAFYETGNPRELYWGDAPTTESKNNKTINK